MTLKLLLTSAGIKNASILDALVDLLGKPIAECDALFIPTGLYAHPYAGPRQAWRSISAQEPNCPMVGLGWKSMGVLELTALPSLPEDRWVPLVREADVLLCDGGDATYLAHWLRETGLAELLPTLNTVWVGLSAGSMVMTPRVGEARRAHPVAQVGGIAAFDQQDVDLSDERNPPLLVETRKRCELEHAHRLPAQPDRRGPGFPAADAPPRLAGPRVGVSVQRGWDAEGIALGDRLTQQIDERVPDARVAYAGGGQKKLQRP